MKNLITDTAQLACNQGTMPNNLLVTSQDFITIEDKPIATEQDVKPNVNIKPFGQCKLKPSSSGFLPCVPALQKWEKIAQKNTINDNAFLTDESFCMCSVGGKISVKDKGHSEVHIIDDEPAENHTQSEEQSSKAENKETVVGENKGKYVRLLFYGGAKKSADNSSFYYASLNVKKDYGSDGEFIHMAVDTAKKIVESLNEQEDSSIQSLDIFCHGSQVGLYFIKGASIHKNITTEEVESKNLNSPLAIGKFNQFINSDLSGDERIISDIDYNKFTNNAKIEIHGCSTAASVDWSPWLDNICEDLSEYLYDAGKKNAVVIGHSTKANPNLPTSK